MNHKVNEDTHNARPLHECSEEEFKARATEAWDDVFAAADKRTANFPPPAMSLSDYLGTSGDAA